MHSPRIRVPTQSSKTTLYKSWNGGKPPKSSASKPLQDEIAKFKISISCSEEENKTLLNTLSAFNTIDEPSAQVFLIDQFEKELNQLSKKIDKRAILIDSIEKKAGRRKEIEFKSQDIFCEKTQLIGENQQLVHRALFLEKKMIAAKLRLRLSHDHRDFCRLKRQLSCLADNDDKANAEEFEILLNKGIINNLKKQIEHEKTRLMRLSVPLTLEEEAAEMIQRVWRGFQDRKNYGQIKSDYSHKMHTIKTNSINGEDSPFPELEHSDSDIVADDSNPHEIDTDEQNGADE